MYCAVPCAGLCCAVLVLRWAGLGWAGPGLGLLTVDWFLHGRHTAHGGSTVVPLGNGGRARWVQPERKPPGTEGAFVCARRRTEQGGVSYFKFVYARRRTEQGGVQAGGQPTGRSLAGGA